MALARKVFGTTPNNNDTAETAGRKLKKQARKYIPRNTAKSQLPSTEHFPKVTVAFGGRQWH